MRTPPPAYKWWVVGMLWFVCFINYADRQSIFSVFPLLQSELRLNDVELGLAGASFMWVYALAGAFAGWLGDRFSRKGLILGALVFWSVVTAGTGLAHNLWELTLCRALGGLGEAFYFPASMSLISDYHAGATRSRAMALHQTSVYAGTIGGGVWAGWLAQHYGWRPMFGCFGVLGIGLAAVLWMFLREPERGAADTRPGALSRRESTALPLVIRELLASRPVVTLIAAFIGANFVAMVFLTWMPSYLHRTFRMDLTMSGWNATAWLQSASVIGVLSGGVLADRLARRRTGARALTQGIGLACGVPFLFLTGRTLSVPVLVAAMAFFGYFKGLYDANIFASLYDVVTVEVRAAAAGLLNSLGWLGAGFAPVLVAAGSRRFGMSACLSATSAIYLGCAILLVWASRRQRPTRTAKHLTLAR